MGSSQPKRLEEVLAHEALLIVMLVGVALVQVTLLSTPLGFPPALLLVLVVCRVLVSSGDGQGDPTVGVEHAVRWAFYGGIALDLCSATPIGSHALALLLAVVLVVVSTRRLRVEGPLLPLIAVLIGTLVYEVVLALVAYKYLLMWHEWLQYGQQVILPSILLALIPTVPIFMVLRRMLYAAETSSF